MAYFGRSKGWNAPPKKVNKYQDGVLIFTYEKLSHAAIDFKIAESTISRYLNGKLKTVSWLPIGITMKYAKHTKYTNQLI